MQYLNTKIPALIFTAVLTLYASAEAFAQANIVIQNNDTPGVGFNDMTPASPVGGNSGTTVGEQRLIAFQAAANIWGATLVSGPTITINARWDETLPCSSNSGTLGAAGNAGSIYRNFPGSVSGFWYGSALAHAILNTDQNGASQEINAVFNPDLGKAGCLEISPWYYGLDNNHGAGTDLVSVVLHELGHGLGFQTFTNPTTGVQAGPPPGSPSIFDRYLFDTSTGKGWSQMTDSERVASAINTGNLVWVGPQVLSDVPTVLSGTPRLRVNSPAAIAGNYTVGTANFGPALSPGGTTGEVVYTSPNDACAAISNSVSGKIALIDRGNCTFVEKTKNAQNAGATGVIIVDNVSNPTPPGLGGSDSTITIPAVSITMANGNTVKAQLGVGVNATLFADSAVLAGADSAGRPRLNAPNPVSQGSSVSHWDPGMVANQLMEPNISSDLLHSLVPPRDLTMSLFRDIGWNSGAPATPSILFETGTAQASALDSITQVRGPFTVLTPNNFSSDGRRRLIFFTTDLGLAPGQTSGLAVQASGIPLPVESAGPFPQVGGTSYVIVRLPDLPPNTYALTVTLNNRSSANAPTITIVP